METKTQHDMYNVWTEVHFKKSYLDEGRLDILQRAIYRILKDLEDYGVTNKLKNVNVRAEKYSSTDEEGIFITLEYDRKVDLRSEEKE